MNFLMGITNLLGAIDFSKYEGIAPWLASILQTVYNIINAIVVPVLVIVATVGIIYSIVLGVNYARAETSDQKEEAKKRIINVVVGALLMIILMLLLWLFINKAPDIFQWVEDTTKTNGSTSKLISNLFIR